MHLLCLRDSTTTCISGCNFKICKPTHASGFKCRRVTLGTMAASARRLRDSATQSSATIKRAKQTTMGKLWAFKRRRMQRKRVSCSSMLVKKQYLLGAGSHVCSACCSQANTAVMPVHTCPHGPHLHTTAQQSQDSVANTG